MGSTVKEDALAGAPDEGKAGTVKQAVTRKTTAKKKATSKKPGKTAKKPRHKAQAKDGKTAQPKQVASAAGNEATAAETAAAAALTPEDANQAVADPRSISWMSAQAVSALKAVKANQARKAESLLARVEKPVPGRAAITELPEQTSDDLLEELPEMEAPAVMATPQATTPTSPAAAGGEPTITKEATVMQDKPGEQETTAIEVETSPAQPAVEAAASATETATASEEAVVAAQAQQRGLPVRPIVMTVFLGLLAYSGYRYWQENRDTFVAAPPVAGSYSESEQDAGWDDIPRQEAIAVVGEASGKPAAPPATVPGVENEAAAPGNTTAGDDLAPGTVTQPGGTTATPTYWKPDVSPAPQETASAPVPAVQAEMETPEPADTTATEPAQPEPAAVVAPPAQPAQPQAPYGAPGYGYYPQQPNWQQQPYYRPTYPPQYPAR
jgi:hypothetical protein